GRAVECGGLENRYPCKRIGGSNPLPSVIRAASRVSRGIAARPLDPSQYSGALMRLVLIAAGALAVAVVVTAAAPAAPARYGGTLVVGLASGEPDSLDPTVSRA